MKKRPHPFRKKWGQNFLNDINLLNKIVEVVKPQTEDLFLEIGPGDEGPAGASRAGFRSADRTERRIVVAVDVNEV